MGLTPGERFTTPARRIGDDDLRRLVEAGGYTHPLFTDPAYAAASTFGRTPLPGPALVLLMGGLVEQSGLIDETVIALVGFDTVRFRAPAFPGDEICVDVEVTSTEPRSDGRRSLVSMRWLCRNERGEALADAAATMLFRT